MYTGSKVIEVVELESKLHSQQCFVLNPQIFRNIQFRDSLILCYYVKLIRPSQTYLLLYQAGTHHGQTNLY